MFLATIDKSKHLLLLSYVGHVTAAELRAGVAAAPELLAELPQGSVRMLADYGRFDSMEPEATRELGELMELADHRGVELIARVMPDSSKDVGLNILSVFHYRKPVTTVTCSSMEEAARQLGI